MVEHAIRTSVVCTTARSRINACLRVLSREIYIQRVVILSFYSEISRVCPPAAARDPRDSPH